MYSSSVCRCRLQLYTDCNAEHVTAMTCQWSANAELKTTVSQEWEWIGASWENVMSDHRLAGCLLVNLHCRVDLPHKHTCPNVTHRACKHHYYYHELENRRFTFLQFRSDWVQYGITLKHVLAFKVTTFYKQCLLPIILSYLNYLPCY